MASWLKDKLLKSDNSNTISNNIDMSCVYRNHLLIRGWCIDESNSPINITVKTEDGRSLPLLAERNDSRPDVIAHLGLEENGQLPGFSHVYYVDHTPTETTITFSSTYGSVSIPFEFSKTLNETLRAEFESLDIYFTEETNEKDSQDVFHAIKAQEHDAMPEPEPEPEPELHAAATPSIHYNIEEIGVYKNNIALIRGWCIDTESNKPVKISASQAQTNLKIIECFKIDRPDVKAYFGDNPNSHSFGFFLLLDVSNNSMDPIELCFSNDEQKISTLESLDNELLIERLEQNLIGGGLVSNSDRKLFLIDLLGVSYLASLESEYVDIHQVKTMMHIDSGISLDSGIFIRGWIDDSQSEIVAIKLTNGNAISADILPSMGRFTRPDINNAFPHLTADFKAGFFSYVAINKHSDPLYAIMVEKSGKMVKLSINLDHSVADEVVATQQILEPIDPHSPELFDIYEKHVAPVLHSIWKPRTKPKNKDKISVIQYGKKISDPICSFIVPLYGRYDFVLHQLAQFELDHDFQDIEIIYVIDDPRIEQATKAMCEDISKLYDISFKLVSSGQNHGFAGANNLGVEYATSDHLLLLNSDVLPSESGWLRRILDTYKSINNIGALGVKLVYEDESIQHIGMSFIQSQEFGGLWLNEHPYKGLPQALVPEISLKSIPTVTAACLLIEKSKYHQIGGFDTQYILGDFEDSDLCLKLLDAGYSNYILGTEKLYHLERLSQSLVQQGDWKFKLTLFNGWQHTKRWNQLITSIEAQ